MLGANSSESNAIAPGMYTPKIILTALWLLGGVKIMHGAAPTMMREYQIELPNHVLHFSLPEEIANGFRPTEINQRFDARDASFIKNGFREIAGTLYEIKGPFWAGTYGSLKFHFMVQRKSPKYPENIATVDGLERYVREWNKTIEGRATGCAFSRSTLNGMSAVRREWDTFNDASDREPENLEIFSLPLNSEMFLDVGFSVRAWEAGRGKEGKWRPKVEALREAIKTTIVLEPKR